MSEGVEFHMKAPNFNPWILVTNSINRKARLVRACPCPQTPVPNIWTPWSVASPLLPTLAWGSFPVSHGQELNPYLLHNCAVVSKSVTRKFLRCLPTPPPLPPCGWSWVATNLAPTVYLSTHSYI